jgi:hypothetical protein
MALRDGVFDYVLGRTWTPTGCSTHYAIMVDNDGCVSMQTEEADVYTNYTPQDARKIAQDILTAADYCELVNDGIRKLGKSTFSAFKGRNDELPLSRYEEAQVIERDSAPEAANSEEKTDV